MLEKPILGIGSEKVVYLDLHVYCLGEWGVVSRLRVGDGVFEGVGGICGKGVEVEVCGVRRLESLHLHQGRLRKRSSGGRLLLNLGLLNLGLLNSAE